jgi:hypothetical protein
LNPIPSKKELNLKPAIVDIYNKQWSFQSFYNPWLIWFIETL